MAALGEPTGDEMDSFRREIGERILSLVVDVRELELKRDRPDILDRRELDRGLIGAFSCDAGGTSDTADDGSANGSVYTLPGDSVCLFWAPSISAALRSSCSMTAA